VAIRVVSVAAFLGVWQYFGRSVDPLFLSYPWAIATALVDMLRSGDLERALQDSLFHLVVGFGIATAVGITIGLLMGRYRIVESTLDSLVSAAYVAPHAAFVPLILLWFGIGTPAKLFIIATATVFPVLISTHAGARNVNPLQLEVGRAFGLSERQIFAKIVLPAVTSHIVSGLRLGVGRAITNVIVAEFLTLLSGLGGLILAEANVFHTSRMFAGVFVLMVLGVALTSLVGWFEGRVASWRDTERAVR
jgi:NitT/TauT family transport system permease protein